MTSKDENSPPCNTDQATMEEVVGSERGTAAAAHSCLKDERRRGLIGEQETQQQLVLPKPPSRARRSRSPSRTRRSMSPDNGYAISRSIFPEPKAKLGHAGDKDAKAEQESRREARGALKENVEEQEETAKEEDSETGDMASCDTEEKRDMLRRTAAASWPTEFEANAVGDPVTESTIAANIERNEATANAVENGAESTPLRPAATATPSLFQAPVPVPTTRSLRMFLGVLKHNPVGLVREVGVLLMVHASSIEVGIAARAAAAGTPSALPANDGCNSGDRGGRGPPSQTKQRRESAHQRRRTEEAATVLALALSAEKKRVGRLAATPAAVAGGVTTERVTKNNKTRFQHQLRQAAKVEDRLQAWAATRGREVSALKELLARSAGGELGASSAAVRLVRDRSGRIPAGQVGKALPEAGQVLEYISSATGAVAGDCASATGSIAAADAPVGFDRDSIVRDDIFTSRENDEPSEVGETSRRPPSDPATWVLSTSNAAEGSDQRTDDASSATRSSGDGLVIWESSSSDPTPNSEQGFEDATPRPLSSDEPVIWEASAMASEQRADGELPRISSDDDNRDSAKRASGVPALPLDDEGYGALAPDVEERVRCDRLRLESSMEQELAKSVGGPVFLSSSSSDGTAASTAAAAVAVEERPLDLVNGGALSVSCDAVAGAGAAGKPRCDANWLSGPCDDGCLATPSPSSDGGPVTIWETSSSEAESEQQHDVAGSPADIGAAAAALEEQPLDLKMPSMWPVDPLEKGRDPLGDIPLVSEDGERNLWDDVLDEQLSKCGPLPVRVTRRMTSNTQADCERTPITTKTEEPFLVTGDRDEEEEEGGGEQQTEEKGELKEREPDGGERGAMGGGTDGEDIEGEVEEGVPREPSSSSLGFDPNSPSLGLMGDALQQQQQQQQEEEEEEEEEGWTAMRLLLAPQYAYLLNQACGSVRDVLQGANVDISVVRAADRAAAAASTAQAAVTEAVALLDEHLTKLPDGASSRSKLQCSLSRSSPSSSEVMAEITRRDRWPVEEGKGGVDDETPAWGEDVEQGQEGERLEEESEAVRERGRSSGGKCQSEVDDRAPAWGAVDEEGQEEQGMDEKANEEESVSSSAQRKADIYWAEVVAEATAAVAAELAERAASTAAAYERTRETGHGGGREEGETSRGGGQQLPRQGKCECYDAWLESRLAAAAAATASRVATATARRAATLIAASTLTPPPAEEGAAEARQGAEHSRLLRERGGGGGGGGGGEGGGEYNPERPAGGNGGRRPKKHSSTNYNVDVGAWNWADVGGGGRGAMADDGRGVRVLKDGAEGGDIVVRRTCAGNWGVVSQGGYSAEGAAGFDTEAVLRCGKPIGSILAASKLSVQWDVDKNPANMGAPLPQSCHQIKRRKDRTETGRRAPEMEEIREKKLAAREQNGGLSPRPSLMGNFRQFPGGGTPNLSSYLPSSASLSSWSTPSSCPSSTSFTVASALPEGLGLTLDDPESLLTPPSTSTSVAGDTAAAESTAATYRLSDEHAEMAERWPPGLLVASKAVIAEVPGLEEHGRRAFEAALERSVR